MHAGLGFGFGVLQKSTNAGASTRQQIDQKLIEGLRLCLWFLVGWWALRPLCLSGISGRHTHTRAGSGTREMLVNSLRAWLGLTSRNSRAVYSLHSTLGLLCTAKGSTTP